MPVPEHATHPLELIFNALNPLPLLVQARIADIACKGINHLLKLEPTVQTHLNPHMGRTVLLRWEALPLLAGLPAAPAGEQALCITEDCFFAPSVETNPSKIDVTICVLAGIATAAPEERLRFIRLEGDVFLAQDLSKVAKELRWDAEHGLARVVGDVPAYWMVHNAKKVAALLQSAVQALKAKHAGVQT